VLAYISWHRPAEGVDVAGYEQALRTFHASLARRPPSGFRGSAALRAPEIPWPVGGQDAELGGAGYEDWYLVESWSAVGVLEEAAVARGHVSRHDALAGKAAGASGAIYRLSEGHARLAQARVAVWVSRAPRSAMVTIGDLLGDGMDPAGGGLWRRCLGLGPAPEYCLLATEPAAGVRATRLPSGWQSRADERTLLWSG
jgi:hypothetical protein